MIHLKLSIWYLVSEEVQWSSTDQTVGGSISNPFIHEQVTELQIAPENKAISVWMHLWIVTFFCQIHKTYLFLLAFSSYISIILNFLCMQAI